MTKLDKLLARQAELMATIKDAQGELESINDIIEAVKECLEEQKQRQEEAYATLITQRNDAGQITDADFLNFERAAQLSNGGLIDEEPETGQEIQEVANT